MSNAIAAKSGGSLAGSMFSAGVGVVLGVDAVGTCLALATICFAGSLSAGLGLATAIFIFATASGTLALYKFGGFRAPLSITQDSSIAIIAPAAAIAASGVTGPAGAQVATVFAVLGTAALASGVTFWLVGRFRLGRLIRMFPYSVAAGFLASSGFLLVHAALSILAGASEYRDIALALTEKETLYSVIPATILAVVLYFAVARKAGTFLLIVALLVFSVGFYLVIGFLDVSRIDAAEMGLLVDPYHAEGGALPSARELYGLIDWGQVATTGPTIAAVVLINLIGFLLNVAGVELGTRSDVDESRELKVTGLINMAIGPIGSLACYLQGGGTLLAAKLGVVARPMIIGNVIFMLAASFFASQIVAAVPVFVAAGLLLFVGLSMISDWAVQTMRRLPVEDRVVIAGIIAVTVVFGILPAIAVGLMLALFGFALGYARLPLVRHASNALVRQSAYDRSPEERAALARQADSICILHLQGALFFGSVENMLDTVKAHSKLPQGLAGLILDMSSVTRFDSSASAALAKIAYTFGDLPAGLHMTGLSQRIQQGFERWGIPVRKTADDDAAGYLIWRDLDEAIEYCEDRLLRLGATTLPPATIASIVAEMCGGDPRSSEILGVLESVDLAEGEALMRANDQDRDMYLVEEGRFGIFLPSGKGRATRVRSVGPSALVGEMAYVLCLGRSADVIAERPSRAWRLRQETIDTLNRTNPSLAALLNLALARAIAAKVVQTNTLLAHERSRIDRPSGH
jgi:SulP family sulfate permease